VLIIVVVMSMALTPGLAEVGKITGDWLEAFLAQKQQDSPDKLVMDILAEEASSKKMDGHQV
jgi:hypothetical protein